MSKTPQTVQIKKNFQNKLNEVRTSILDVIKRYQKLDEEFLDYKFEEQADVRPDINKFDIAIEVIENKLKLCDLDLQVLEVEPREPTYEDVRNKQRIRELEESLRDMTEKFLRQKALQRQMETTFKESKQKRVEHMRTLLEELKKYMNHMDLFRIEELRKKSSLAGASSDLS